MIIESLELKDFRNYQYLSISLNKDINIFYGQNAQGKTNVLESIYVASTTRSQLRAKDKEMIRFGCEDSHIKMNMVKNDIHYRIDMHLKNNKNKGIAVNGVICKKIKDYIGSVHVISFSPEDLNLIKNGPAERRRFLDSELCQLYKAYLYDLTRYNKIIVQRNALLKELSFKTSNMDTLNIWDEELIRYGLNIIRYRKEYIDDINEIIGDIHRKLTNKDQKLLLKYEPDISDEYSFRDKIGKNRAYEIKMKTTMYGPQRDDISFELDGIDMRKYGSQGQKRTIALALKLAQIEIVKKKTGDSPILLLDDVMSELDSERQGLLLNNIKDVQTIITCTGIDEFIEHNVPYENIFYVENGNISYKGKSV